MNANEIASDLFLIIDSREDWRDQFVQAVTESIINNDASVANPAEDYERAMFWGSSSEDFRAFLDAAGPSVRDTFIDMVDNDLDSSSFAYMALMDMVDVNNRQVWVELAEHFMPTPDEIVW